MMSGKLIIIWCLLLVFLASCATAPEPVLKGTIEKTPAQVDQKDKGLYSAEAVSKNLPDSLWSYEEKGIAVRFVPDKYLNMYEGSSHTLYVGIFQLNNPSKFNKIVSTKTGVEELLSAEKVDDSILSSEKVIVYPGEEKVFILDRAEQAKYIAIICGYANLDGSGSVRVVPIPGMQEPRKNLMSFLSEPDIRAAIVKLWVTLGEQRIKSVELRSQ